MSITSAEVKELIDRHNGEICNNFNKTLKQYHTQIQTKLNEFDKKLKELEREMHNNNLQTTNNSSAQSPKNDKQLVELRSDLNKLVETQTSQVVNKQLSLFMTETFRPEMQKVRKYVDYRSGSYGDEQLSTFRDEVMERPQINLENGKDVRSKSGYIDPSEFQKNMLAFNDNEYN